ncbi:small multi-drug export protein [Clostridium oceanicum]|uniref:Small multi-drug export protein n=1 Tax=Clostridium oceanicum TaxID=1543 RepID=A0ABN1JHB5_9CLOT
MLQQLIYVALSSAVPLTEQRLAIPVAVGAGSLDPIHVCIASYLGSLLPVPFVLLFFNAIFKWMKKYKAFDKINIFIENKIRKNSAKMVKYKELGLIAFIAIPLPTTGIWTGSVVAAVLGLDIKKSMLCAAIGGLISAVLITVISVVVGAAFFGV